MLNQIPNTFTKPFQHWNKVAFFKKSIYIFLLLNTFSLLPVAEEIFSYHGIVGSRGWNTSIPWYKQGSAILVNFLSHPINSTYPWIYKVFIGGQITALVFGILRILPKLSAIFIYFFSVNLFLKGYLAFTGGEVLASILLFYLIFIQKNDVKDEENSSTSLQNVLNNTFYWIILIQVCLVYVLSTLYKLYDLNWLNGDALLYISRIDAFSSDMMRGLFAENPKISALFTYFSLFYQGLFPVLIWFKKIKIPFLIAGVILHLGIAIGMGIFTFGILMLLIYLLFLENNQIEKIQKTLVFRKRK